MKAKSVLDLQACLTTVLVCMLASVTALAQTYSVNWSAVDGGGGTSTGGVYTVSGTIGQPDAGKLAGSNYTLEGGFWGIVGAVQTPGAPYAYTSLRGENVTINGHGLYYYDTVSSVAQMQANDLADELNENPDGDRGVNHRGQIEKTKDGRQCRPASSRWCRCAARPPGWAARR